ncbi:MAG: UDP-N-acetylmuramate--L-alanine ligase [Minisyncoccia bacterium]|jgi:UDP-N-acetylmuramate--alanine ligase
MKQNKAHFIGVGGIGMSALARYFLAKKWAVSGSDLVRSQITKALGKEGVMVKIGHKKGNISRNLDLVVYNRAILPGNPELIAARALGVRALPYAEVLGEITRSYFAVAVTGSHGKSTTTALAGLALMKGGLDPVVMVGTNLAEFGGKNIRIGHGHHLVFEADDFGGAFTHYSPSVAIVTNIDREHLDFYKNFANLKKAFLKFLKSTRLGGTFILNRDDKPLYSLRARIAGIAQKKNIRIFWYSLRDPEAKKIKRVIKIPGAHNISNALAVYKLGKVLDIPERTVLTAIGAYRGAWRRMEYRGKFGGALVYDDYAHHPTEIKATLQAFREKYPHKKIVCVFQPHQAKRLKALFGEFTTAFKDADKTLLLPIYKVAGRDEKPGRFDSEALARAVQKREPKKLFFYLAEPHNLKNALCALAIPLSQHVIIMMGAGDIVNLTDSLIKK